MITLRSLIQLEDGRFYAKWFDCDDISQSIGHTVGAIHASDGRPEVANLGLHVPGLTAEQMQQAQPDQHKAYQLAALGITKRPDWANRYQKAAELVEAGHVRLTGPDTAVVTGSEEHNIYDDKCHCKWMTFNPSEPCSHYLAVRMARALNQPIEPLTEAEKEARGAARRQANRDATQLRIASRGENIHERNRQQARRDGDGARQWIRAAQANGRITIPPPIWERAYSGGD